MTFRILLIAMLLLAAPSLLPAADDPVRLGERIYRQGILPDGRPLIGYIRDDVEIDSTAVSCANCHNRSGLGSVEGQIISPPINGPHLFAPRNLLKDEIKNQISRSRGKERSSQPVRPAYDRKSLALAIAGGIGPGGRELNPVMPRYDITDEHLGILIDYLAQLSSTPPPGIDDRMIRLATIVTDDVPEIDRAFLLKSLDTLVDINRQYQTQKNDRRFFKMFRMLDAAFYKELVIDVWELKGDPATWRQQLEGYYSKHPVFAIIGGISYQPWEPIHRFCEDHKLPCLFPLTDLPVISETDWYTVYPSRGYYLEGETAARFIARSTDDPKRVSVLQLVAVTAAASALKSAFDAEAREHGMGDVETMVIPKDGKIDGMLKDIGARRYDYILFWGGRETLPMSASFAPLLAADGKLFVSARLIEERFDSIPSSIRNRTIFTYPYRLPEDEMRFVNYRETFTLGKVKGSDTRRVATRTYSMIHLFLTAYREMRLNYYRDNMLDVLGMLPDQYLPDFVRLSFGPGQRYLSKGCYVARFDDDRKVIVPLTDWVFF
ncbi:MAG: ABC transporter substrate-binding protein [Desulfuromonadia bacterium]